MLDMSNNQEQGNFGVTRSIDFHKKRVPKNDNVNQSAYKIITERIEEIKHSPSMEGCGKETILIIIFIVAVIVSFFSIYNLLVWTRLPYSPQLVIHHRNDPTLL